MLRGIAVLWVMAWHYIKNTFKRHKYSIEGKELDVATKKANRKEIYKMMQDLSNGMIKAAGTTIEIKGKENLPKEGPVVYMATHKGLYDSPIMAHLLDDPIIFIGKEETKKMPIISRWFDAMGCIYLARDDMKKSLQAILEGIKELKEGQSIVIFPEGTRSKGEEMAEFKAGSFKLATKANVPIVPIAIQNTHKILEEKGSIQKTTVYINIGEMIDVAALSAEEKKELPKTVENKVRSLLQEITQ
ncbi:MAG: lysophospholipid acyltransferase family protein [Cellulosilyticaceae bacterium]